MCIPTYIIYTILPSICARVYPMFLWMNGGGGEGLFWVFFFFAFLLSSIFIHAFISEYYYISVNQRNFTLGKKIFEIQSLFFLGSFFKENINLPKKKPKLCQKTTLFQNQKMFIFSASASSSAFHSLLSCMGFSFGIKVKRKRKARAFCTNGLGKRY